MRIMVYTNRKINYIFLFSVALLIASFFLPWYTIYEKKAFSKSHSETSSYNYRPFVFEQNDQFRYGDESREITIRGGDDESRGVRTSFIFLFGIVYIIIFIFIMVRTYKKGIRSRRQLVLFSLVPILLLLLLFIFGYSMAYEKDYDQTEYRYDDLYMKSNNFIDFQEKNTVRGYGIDSSSECTTSMYWFPSYGFFCLVLFLVMDLALLIKHKPGKNDLLEMIEKEFTIGQLRDRFKEDIRFKFKLITMIAMILVILSLISPWFTIRFHYTEGDDSSMDYKHNHHYYLNKLKVKSNYHLPWRTTYEPYSNEKFKEKDMGEKYFVNALTVIYYILIALVVLYAISFCLLQFKKDNIKFIAGILIFALVLLAFIIPFYCIYSNIALQKDNDSYYDSDSGYYPKGDLTQFPIDTIYGADSYESGPIWEMADTEGYKDSAIWYLSYGFYLIIPVFILNIILLKQYKNLRNLIPKEQ